MIVDKLVEKLPIRSNFTKLIAGSILTALLIALGMVGILKLLDFSINPAIPAVLGGGRWSHIRCGNAEMRLGVSALEKLSEQQSLVWTIPMDYCIIPRYS